MIRYADMLKKLGKGGPTRAPARTKVIKTVEVPPSPFPEPAMDAGMTLDDRPAVTVSQTPAVVTPVQGLAAEVEISDRELGRALSQGRMTPLDTVTGDDADGLVAESAQDDEIDALFAESPAEPSATAGKTIVEPVASLSSAGLSADEPADDADIDALFADKPAVPAHGEASLSEVAGLEAPEESSKTWVDSPVAAAQAVPAPAAAPAEPATITSPSDEEIDALFSEAPAVVAKVEEAPHQASESEIDALFSEAPGPQVPSESPKPADKAARLADHAASTEQGIDSLFAETPSVQSSQSQDSPASPDAKTGGNPLGSSEHGENPKKKGT